MNFQTERPAEDMRALLADFGLCSDIAFHGEIAALFENRGYKRLYYRPRGLKVDELGEKMLDRGIVAERPCPRDILDYLGDLFRADLVQKVPGRKRATVASVDVMERKARKMRLRLFECSCGQKARGTRNSSLLCGLCFELHGEIRPMRRVDPLPEEILEQAAATMEGAAR